MKPRGPSGGYLFAKRPDFIMIYDVISAIDEDLKITDVTALTMDVYQQKKVNV